MGNSTTKTLIKSKHLETEEQNSIHSQIDNQLAMYSIDEQKEIQALRQQLDKDIEKEKTRLLLETIELDKKWILYLIQKMIEYNIKKKAYDNTISLVEKKYNPVNKTEKRHVMLPLIRNRRIMARSMLNTRNQIIHNLFNYVFELKKHFGDDVSYILQDHFDLTDIYHNFMVKYKKSTFNVKKINWSTLSSNDTNMIYEYYMLQNSLKEWKSVVKSHPNKKGHVIFNADYLKLKQNK